MRTKQEIEEEIQKLQKELKDLSNKYDWDNLTSEQIQKLWDNDHEGWNLWDNCPVGTLTGPWPEDKILYHLAMLTDYVSKENWSKYVNKLRTIVRIRMEELENE